MKHSQIFWRQAIVFLSVALCFFGFSPVKAFAQAAPPPPPTEGLDPSTAPKSSRETVTASPAPSVSGMPAAPTEGLDPATAPATSTGAVKPEANKAKTDSVDVEGAIDESKTAKASLVDVFKLDFMQRALFAGLLVGGACAFLGVYVVLRRVVFVGVALAEMSSAGVALALLTGLAPMVGSVVMMAAGVFLFSVRWGGRRIRQDAFIGIGYVVASAASVLLIAKSPSGEGSLLELLIGNILTVSMEDIWVTAVALGLTVLFHVLFYKEILFVAFDPDTAAASGYNSRVWEMWIYLTVGLIIAFAIHTVGVMMTFASLVIPAVTALLLTKRMLAAFGVAVIVGMIPVPIGLYISYVADLPAAATIVVINFALLIIAGVISRFRS